MNQHMMNWNLISEKWNSFSSQLKSQWDKLTDEDLKEIDGSQEALTFKLQERYGFLRMDAEKKVADWGTEVTSNLEKSPKNERVSRVRSTANPAGSVAPLDDREAAVDPRHKIADEEQPEDPNSKLTPPVDRRHESRDRVASQSSADNTLP